MRLYFCFVFFFPNVESCFVILCAAIECFFQWKTLPSPLKALGVLLEELSANLDEDLQDLLHVEREKHRFELWSLGDSHRDKNRTGSMGVGRALETASTGDQASIQWTRK